MLLTRILKQLLRPAPAAADPADLAAGLALYKSGRYDDAVAHCRRLETRHTASAPLLHLRGIALWELGRLEDAAEALEKAHALDDSNADYLSSLAQVEQALGQRQQPLQHYQAILALHPETELRVHAHLQAGTLLRKTGQPEDAIRHFQAVVEIQPDSWQAHQNLFLSHYDAGEFDQARVHIERALQIAPADAMTRLRHAIWVPAINESQASIRQTRAGWVAKVNALLEAPAFTIDDPVNDIGSNGFYLAYHGENDRDLQALAAKLFRRACPTLDFTAPHCMAPRAGRRDANDGRTRVGFLSKHLLSGHPVGRCFNKVIATLCESTRLDVNVILFGEPTESMLANAPPNCSTHVLPAELDAARRRVAGLELDVLVYTDIGMEPFSNFLAHSRLAAVQCAMSGHPVTTGIPSMDYFLSCELAEIPAAQQHYTEKLIAFKSLPSSFPAITLPAVAPQRAEFGLTPGRHIYVCPSRLQKMHPDFDFVMAEILRRDPDGEIVLFRDFAFDSWHRVLAARFGRTIPDVAGRIRFLPWAKPAQFTNLLCQCDVALDTFHFGLGTTAFYAFAAGIPVVTLPATYMRGRSTLAVYAKMGVTDCIADSPQHYVEIAVRLACDAAHRAAVSRKILEHSAPLYEDSSIAPELESFFIEALAQREPGAAQERSV